MRTVTNLWKVKMENCTPWKTKSRPDPSKGKRGGKGKTDRECFRCGRIGHIRADCRANTHINGGPPKIWKSVGNCEDEENRDLTKCAIGTIDLGYFELLSHHGDEVGDDESTNETTEMMPPLPHGSWFKRTETFCGKFRNYAMKITKTRRIHSLLGWEARAVRRFATNGSSGTKRTEV